MALKIISLLIDELTIYIQYKFTVAKVIRKKKIY